MPRSKGEGFEEPSTDLSLARVKEQAPVLVAADIENAKRALDVYFESSVGRKTCRLMSELATVLAGEDGTSAGTTDGRQSLSKEQDNARKHIIQTALNIYQDVVSPHAQSFFDYAGRLNIRLKKSKSATDDQTSEYLQNRASHLSTTLRVLIETRLIPDGELYERVRMKLRPQPVLARE